MRRAMLGLVIALFPSLGWAQARAGYRVTGAAAGAAVERAGGDVPLAANMEIRPGEKIRVDAPGARVRLCGEHQIVLERGEYRVLEDGRMQHLDGKAFYGSSPCPGTPESGVRHSLRLLLGDGEVPIPLGVKGTRFAVELQRGVPPPGAPLELARAGAVDLEVLVADGALFAGEAGSRAYHEIAAGQRWHLGAAGYALTAAEAASIEEVRAALPEETAAPLAPAPGGPTGTGSSPTGASSSQVVLPSHVPLAHRPLFWGLLAGGVALVAGGVVVGLVVGGGSCAAPSPSLGRIGAP